MDIRWDRRQEQKHSARESMPSAGENVLQMRGKSMKSWGKHWNYGGFIPRPREGSLT